jgi:hypothetical protein
MTLRVLQGGRGESDEGGEHRDPDVVLGWEISQPNPCLTPASGMKEPVRKL